MASVNTESEASSLVLSGRGEASGWADHPIVLRVISIALFALIWEIAGRIPVSFAFPTFSDTMVAFFGLIADGSMFKAYLSTLQPLIIGVVLSAVLGVAIGTLCGLSRLSEWLLIPVFLSAAARRERRS